MARKYTEQCARVIRYSIGSMEEGLGPAGEVGSRE